MSAKPPLSHTATRYLQAINTLAQAGDKVRQVAVAKHLDVRPSTCFESILRLLKKGLIAEDEHKHLSLTKTGQETLESIERNQYIFTSFFRDVLGDCCQDSVKLAAQIEPLIDFDTATQMCKFSRFLEHIKGQKIDFHKAWNDFEDNIALDSVCKKCIHQEQCLKRTNKV